LICSACGTANDVGRKFCIECGTALAALCPSCGGVNPPAAKFCGECGSGLADSTPARNSEARQAREAAPPIPEPPPGRLAERRLVSVLFVDLVGFTTLAEARDAEEVRELLGRYFETARHLIALYGGVVEKFIGDAVMAVWGAPSAQEDDAERAVRAALELVEGVGELGTEVGLPELRARAGVLTGEAAVTIGAKDQGMVAGDLVNTASRIQTLAVPGTVLVGDSTRRSTESAVAYQDAGRQEVKGKSQPVQLWRAQRIIAGIGGAIKSSGYEAPFVGRQRELRLVKEVFHTCAEQGRVHLVSVVGIAGIGKSRLAWEFFKYIDGLAQDIWWHRGRCLSYGEGVTYWALAEMVRMRLRISEGEGAASSLDKLRAVLEEFVADPGERRWIEPRISHLLGIEEHTARQREDLFAAWRLFFERIADRSPVVMVFDDIQWADASLLDFIEYLLEWSKEFPIYVLTLGRPEVLEQRSTWGAGKRNFTSLSLDPLSEGTMRELVEGLVPGLPEKLRNDIVDRAEGVPLYAVETVRMLTDRGLVVKEGDSFTTRSETMTLEIPETLQALIAARLDGLPGAERHLLQDASVFGKTFTGAAIASLREVDRGDLETLLASLVRKDLLGLQADPRSPEAGQYGFLQDLFRRVAYNTLSKRDRKLRHIAAARYLETSRGGDPDEIVEVIGSHYVEAFRLAPDEADASQLQKKASELLARAGERAGSLAANEEAEAYFSRAAEMSDDVLERAAMLERAGDMAAAGARTERAIAHLQQALGVLEREDESHRAARVLASLGECLWNVGRIDDGVEMMNRSLAVLSGDELDEDVASLAAQLGRFLLFAGETKLAAERIDMALEAAESLELPHILSEALNTQGVLRLFGGRKAEALALLKHSLEIALEHDLHISALRAYFNLSGLEMNADRYDTSRAYVHDGLALARKLGHRQWEWNLLSQDVYPLFALGKWDAALKTVADIPSESYSVTRTAFATVILVVPLLCVYRGELDRAEGYLEFFAEAAESKEVQERAAFAVGKAAVLRARGRGREAQEIVRTAVAAREAVGVTSELFREGAIEAVEGAFAENDEDAVRSVLAIIDGTPRGKLPTSLLAQSLRAKGRLALLNGDAAESGRLLTGACGLFRELATPFWLGVTSLELGECLGEQGREQEASPLVDEARAIFEQLGAAPWLERARRLALEPGGRT